MPPARSRVNIAVTRTMPTKAAKQKATAHRSAFRTSPPIRSAYRTATDRQLWALVANRATPCAEPPPWSTHDAGAGTNRREGDSRRSALKCPRSHMPRTSRREHFQRERSEADGHPLRSKQRRGRPTPRHTCRRSEAHPGRETSGAPTTPSHCRARKGRQVRTQELTAPAGPARSQRTCRLPCPLNGVLARERPLPFGQCRNPSSVRTGEPPPSRRDRAVPVGADGGGHKGGPPTPLVSGARP
jgi:hypothetical protein